IVFKLERERPPFALNNNILYYIKERYIRRCILGRDGKPDKDIAIIGYRRQGGSGGANLGTKGGTPFTLHFNPAEQALLLCSNSNTENATYELFNLPKGVEDIKPGSS
uniref:hypothetical protein n=1 Tax=Salmonella sp. s51228 TaxID=3159652 RepID=UPI0039817E40